jgi:hypothetical protein
MARQRTTFGKLQRDRDKQAKARAKADKRAARAEARQQDDGDDAAAPADQAALLESLARLHSQFEDGELSLEDFEERKEALTQALRVD